jgi:hypothetical protein
MGFAALQIPRTGENASSGSGDGSRDQYSANSELLRAKTDSQNQSIEVCEIGTLNSATVSHTFLGRFYC